jgi:hypothetical protein
MSDWAMVRSEDERRRWDLVCDDAVQGALHWEGIGRRRAMLSAGGAGWRIARTGLVRAGYDITDAAAGTAVGTFLPGRWRSSGTLALPPHAYAWRRASRLNGWRALEAGDDKQIARFLARGRGRERVRIEVADAVGADVQPLPLVLLACAFVAEVQRNDEQSAAAGAVAAGA